MESGAVESIDVRAVDVGVTRVSNAGFGDDVEEIPNLAWIGDLVVGVKAPISTSLEFPLDRAHEGLIAQLVVAFHDQFTRCLVDQIGTTNHVVTELHLTNNLLVRIPLGDQILFIVAKVLI